MPDDYRQRLVDAPSREWLDLEQAATYLNLSAGEFMERVRLGIFPAGSHANIREPQWSWQVIQALSWLRPMMDAQYLEHKSKRRRDDKTGRISG